MTETLIALDAGTTGVTAVLFDADLRPVARRYREFAQSFPSPGRVEHDAGAILEAADRVLAELAAEPRFADAVALGITNQRETVFAVERAGGRALRPGIVWQDRRTAARCRELEEAGKGDLVRERTGLLVDPYFSATKVEWMLREDPDVRRGAERGEVAFVTVDTLLVAHLCGADRLVTEPTNASRTMLFGIEAGAWDAELCGLFGVDPAWLPEVLPSVGEFGRTLPERTGGRSLPVLGIAGDQQAALFGQGCLDPGSFKTTYGTGSFLLLNTGSERVSSTRGLVTTLAVGRDGGIVFALEGSVFVSGALVQWLRDQLGILATSAEVEELALSVPDSAGVHVVPAFAGLGAPYWDPDARGAVLGLTRGAGRAHLARASLEAIAFQNAELIEILREESGLAIDSLLADGGAAANGTLMQIQADLAAIQVVRPEDVEATARGAASLAGLGAGLWQDPGRAGAFGDPTRTFTPALDEEERRDRMAGWREAVERVRSRPS